MFKIGFVGLGIMGMPMAVNLIKANFPLHVYTRRPNAAAPLIKDHAIFHDNLSSLAKVSDIIITMLPATSDVEQVLLGDNGLIHSAKPGSIIIDMSTISASKTKEMADTLAGKQIEMLDAPVSGGEQGAIDATLAIMVGGKREILEHALLVLKALGKQITHIGDHGAGQIAKACNQIIIAETIIAVSEALSLAKASGIDPAKVREALLGGFASSRILEVHGNRMLENNYQPGFKAMLHRKDINLALEQAKHAALELPGANYAKNCLDQLVENGYADLDSAALHLLMTKSLE